MVKARKYKNGARIYDGNAKNSRVKIKFINLFYFYEKYAKNKNL
jgi:hypothetical protein